MTTPAGAFVEWVIRRSGGMCYQLMPGFTLGLHDLCLFAMNEPRSVVHV